MINAFFFFLIIQEFEQEAYDFPSPISFKEMLHTVGQCTGHKGPGSLTQALVFPSVKLRGWAAGDLKLAAHRMALAYRCVLLDAHEILKNREFEWLQVKGRCAPHAGP